VTKKPNFIPLLVLLFLVASTILTWQITDSFAQKEAHRVFLQKADLVKTGVEYRLNTQLLAAEGFAGLVEGSERVSREEWSRAAKRVDLQARYPGLSSINYVERVSASSKQAFINELQSDPVLPAQERSQLTIFPDSNKAEYFVVKYVEPLEGRINALGYDISSNAQRLAAIQEAMYSAHSVSTGKIDLITTGQAGFGFLTPIYAQPVDEDTPAEQREASLKGFVYLIFRGDNLFREVFSPQNLLADLDIEIYTSTPADAQFLLFDSWPEINISEHGDDEARLKTETEINVNDNRWTLLVGAQDDYQLPPSQMALPKVVLAAGLVVNAIYLAIYRRFLRANPLKDQPEA
jgi:CHASE1-domain containing sensor protein